MMPGRRRAAVLVLLVDAGEGPRVLLTRRSDRLHYLPGAVSFPGGGLEEADGGPVDAALREAEEEVALDPGSVEVLGALPDRTTPDERFVVTPVVAWTRHLQLTAPPGPDEVAEIGLVPLADLTPLVASTQPSRIWLHDGRSDVGNGASAGAVAPMTAALLAEIAAACRI